MGKSVLAVVLGLILGVVIIFVVEGVSHLLYPPPPGLDINNPKVLKAAMANVPFGALLFVLLAVLATAGSLPGLRKNLTCCMR